MRLPTGDPKGWTETRRHYSLETGSTYITYTSDNNDDIEVIVRFSDHAEAYPPKRGERRYNVDSFSNKWSEVKKMMLAGDLPEPYVEVELSQMEKDALRDEAIQRSKEKAGRNRNWRALRSLITLEDMELAKKHRFNRPIARELAEKYNTTTGKMYSAITNGKRF